MKTAEEWFNYFATKGSEVTHLQQSEEAFFDFMCKQIQLDAMKEGMRRAAKNVANRNGPEDCQTCLAVAKEAILTAAEQLTEKDL